MSPSATDNMKSNLGQTGGHLKDAAGHAGDALKGDLADSALSGIAALEQAGAASREQMDALMDKSRDLIDSASELIRERPLASFGVAFAAGWIIAKLARSGDK